MAPYQHQKSKKEEASGGGTTAGYTVRWILKIRSVAGGSTQWSTNWCNRNNLSMEEKGVRSKKRASGSGTAAGQTALNPNNLVAGGSARARRRRGKKEEASGVGTAAGDTALNPSSSVAGGSAPARRWSKKEEALGGVRLWSHQVTSEADQQCPWRRQGSLVQDFTVGLLPEGRLRQKPFRLVTKGPLRTGL